MKKTLITFALLLASPAMAQRLPDFTNLGPLDTVPPPMGNSQSQMEYQQQELRQQQEEQQYQIQQMQEQQYRDRIAAQHYGN